VNQQVAPKTVPKLNCCNSASSAPFPKVSGNHKLTEYFPVRRSIRKTKRTVLEEQQRDLEEAILSQREDGLEVVCTLLFIHLMMLSQCHVKQVLHHHSMVYPQVVNRGAGGQL
jgi:hypothetical protein